MPDGLAGFAKRITLTASQRVALDQTNAAVEPGAWHLIEGEAGTGKTELIKEFIRDQSTGQIAKKRKRKTPLVIAASAPTHKASHVLGGKLTADGLGTECRTLHSLLGLRPMMDGERQIFVRDKKAKPIEADIVVVDECSMPNAEMMAHIRRHLSGAFVLFVGDEAQLPPIGEDRSQSFDIKSKSLLTEIVRQAEGNPIIQASRHIRRSQRGPADWSWCRPNHDGTRGIFTPGRDAERWMQKAFKSDEFAENPDAFRYLAYTRDRVARINARVREWRYGANVETPFVVGERALFLSALVRGDSILFNTNEEVEVLAIKASTYRYRTPERDGVESWTFEFPAWVITMPREGGNGADGEQSVETVEVHMPMDMDDHEAVCNRLAKDAKQDRKRWEDLQAFKAGMAMLQPIYAITLHGSQGSTFGRVFVDMPSILWRAKTKLLEAQQLSYVGLTRPTTAAMLIGT